MRNIVPFLLHTARAQALGRGRDKTESKDKEVKKGEVKRSEEVNHWTLKTMPDTLHTGEADPSEE
jgi:hypothetical protein